MSGSIFTLSFAIELANVEATQEGTDEDYLSLQNYVDGFKISYELYPGFSKELNVVVWPQCAKVLCDEASCWVRTWRLDGGSWVAVSVRHLVPARAQDYQGYTVSVVPAGAAALSSGAKSIRGGEVSFPSLKFNERPNFGGVINETEGEGGVEAFIRNTVWACVQDHIPACKYDIAFDVPEIVTDIRHQDAILGHATQFASRWRSETDAPNKRHSKDEKKGSDPKEKKGSDAKYELVASGDVIMAGERSKARDKLSPVCHKGAGRVISLRASGTAPKELEGFAVFLSTLYLPTDDDLPIIFVNIDNLNQAPVREFLKTRISHVYTRWQLGTEQHSSPPRELSTTVNVDDHHVCVLTHDIGLTVVSAFLDNPFTIELRGIREKREPELQPTLYGTSLKQKSKTLAPAEEECDVLIGLFQIEAERIAKGFNTLIKGEFSVKPPTINYDASRQELCTNDINSIGVEFKPRSCLPNYVLLESQMSLEVSLGFLGCKPHRGSDEFSRLFFLLEDEDGVGLLHHVTTVNETLTEMGRKDDILTGFAVDTGYCLFALIEGKKDGKILDTLQMAIDTYPTARVVFSTVAKYSRKVYDDSIIGKVPLKVFKMSISLSLLVACPMLYVRPAVPLPARAAVLKLHRLISRGLTEVPWCDELPTIHELRSFRLEFCAPPKRDCAPEKWVSRYPNKDGKITFEKGF